MPDTGSPASELRLRRRLTLAFVAVAAVTGAVLVTSTMVVTYRHRHQVFLRRAREEVELSIVSAPPDGSVESLRAMLRLSRDRIGVGTVVVAPDGTVSSSETFSTADVPAPLFERTGEGAVHHSSATVGGHRYVVFSGSPRDGVKVFFFFPSEGLDRGIAEFAVALAGGWLLAVLASAAFGNRAARRTLRPLTAEIEAISRAEARERQFTADVAHELRTPISAMMSAAEILGQEAPRLPADVRRPVELLVDDVTRLSDLVLELLELARLDAGVEPLHLERLSVDEALSAATSRWPGTGAIVIATEPGLTVLADRARFRRVMVNLVRNALTHGGTSVTIGARRRNGAVAIEVRDSGPGLTPEMTQRIFERFYKGDTSRSSSGSGLGLAIALEHARAQGGSLAAANAAEGGACFTFTLPAAPGPTDPATSA